MQRQFLNFNPKDKVVVNRGSIDMSEQGKGVESARVDQQRRLEVDMEELDSQEEEHVDNL